MLKSLKISNLDDMVDYSLRRMVSPPLSKITMEFTWTVGIPLKFPCVSKCIHFIVNIIYDRWDCSLHYAH